MTILQLRAVLLTAQLGSISAAAKELNVSQPNASNSIKLLEKEIGFPIFHRASTGIILTQKGEQFLQHARQILDQNEKIMGLRSTQEVYRLRVGCVYYTPAVNAFLTLCEAHRDDPKADFRYFSVSIAESIELLSSRDLDIAIAPVMRHQISGLVSECKRSNTAMTSMGVIPADITIRSDHPAIADGRCKNLAQGSDAMKDFPYVSNRDLYADNSSTGLNDSDFVQCSYKILVDELDMKLRLLSVTNAFSFGIRTTNPMMKYYNLTSFPVPGITLEAFVLTRPGDADRREIREYLELLRKELQAVMM